MHTDLPHTSDAGPAHEGPHSASLRPVASSCTAGNCPTVYLSGTGTLVVQGYTVSAERAGLAVPEGETLVEIPLELLADAVRNLT